MAIEVKHGGKGWTVRDLEKAIRGQLAIDYLQPATRRQGVFLITYHGGRQWRDPETKVTMTFDAVIERLRSIAATILENNSGAIEVRVVGLNAANR